MSDQYLSQAFSDLYKEDGLLVMARGLGINRLLCKFIQHYKINAIDDVKHNRKSIVFCINAFDNRDLVDENTYINSLFSELLAEGIMPHELPKIITNEVNSQERCDIYNNDSGVFFITSRILIVDMLDMKINPANILGFLVPNAHKITEFSIEAFILRVYRESNNKGFIKGFTEDPENLMIPTNKLEKCLKSLFIKKLYIYPRFHSTIHSVLSNHSKQPDVIEINIDMNKSMKMIQNGILVAIKNCLYELKRSLQGTIHHSSVLDEIFTNYDTNYLLFDSNYDKIIRYQLDNDWHRISYRIKNLLSDIKELKKLLDYLLKYDSFSFYYYLLKLKQSSGDNYTTPSLWLTSEASNHIFSKSKERVYKIISKLKLKQKNYSIPNYIDINIDIPDVIIPMLECPPKWKALSTIIKEILENKDNNNIQSKILIIVKDNLTLTQLRDYLITSDDIVMDIRYRWFISQQSSEIRNKYKRIIINNNNIKNNTKNSIKNNINLNVSSGLKRNYPKNIKLTKINTLDQNELDQSINSNNDNDNNDDNKILGLDKKYFFMLSNEEKLILLEENRLQNITQSYNNETNSIINTEIKDIDETIDESNTILGKRKLEDETNDDIVIDSSIILYNNQHIILSTHSQCINNNTNLLNDCQPTHIIIYDVDISIIRNVEVYQLNRNDNYPSIKVYILSYNESAEQHRYVDSLTNEKKSFESLILRKQDLVITLPDLKPLIMKAKQEDMECLVDSRQLYNEYSLITSNTNSHNNNRKPRVVLQPAIELQVVVDVREFRSTLPLLLHINGFNIIPRTLTIGDYILSSDICIERKGISDLFQSFQSGRLFNQITSMVKHYKYPCLLIEFTDEKSFALQSVSDITPDIQSNNINTRLSVLTITFPSLHILWSKSPQDTSIIFQNLILSRNKRYEPIDIDKVVQIGLESNDSIMESLDNRQTAIEILLSIPGIDKNNYFEIIKKVNNLKELSKLKENELIPMIGPINSKKVIQFFKQRII